jgi:hypothetical protein
MTCYTIDLTDLRYELPRPKAGLFRYFETGHAAIGLLLYRNGTVIETRAPSLDQTLAADDWLPCGGQFDTSDWQYDVLVDAGYTLVPCDGETSDGYTDTYGDIYTGTERLTGYSDLYLDSYEDEPTNPLGLYGSLGNYGSLGTYGG